MQMQGGPGRIIEPGTTARAQGANPGAEFADLHEQMRRVRFTGGGPGALQWMVASNRDPNLYDSRDFSPRAQGGPNPVAIIDENLVATGGAQGGLTKLQEGPLAQGGGQGVPPEGPGAKPKPKGAIIDAVV